MDDRRQSDQDINELKVDVGIMKNDIKAQGSVLEEVRRDVKNFAFVPLRDFVDFKKFIDENYATKEEIRPFTVLYWGMLGAIATGIGGSFVFLVTKGLQ